MERAGFFSDSPLINCGSLGVSILLLLDAISPNFIRRNDLKKFLRIRNKKLRFQLLEETSYLPTEMVKSDPTSNNSAGNTYRRDRLVLAEASLPSTHVSLSANCEGQKLHPLQKELFHHQRHRSSSSSIIINPHHHHHHHQSSSIIIIITTTFTSS